MIQGTADAVVVEQSGLAGLQAQVFGDAAGRPGGDGIQGLACQEQVAEQDAEGHRGGQGRPASGQGRQVPREQLGELQALQEVLQEGRRADLEGFQGSLLPRQGHSCLPARRGRADCCGSAGTNDKGAGEVKKILARRGCRGQPGQDFF